MSSTAIYARKESSEFGSLFLIWCTYHQSLVDLYRISIPQLFKIRNSVPFPPEQGAFVQLCQKTCAQNAQQVVRTIAEAMSHGTNKHTGRYMDGNDCIRQLASHAVLQYTNSELANRTGPGGGSPNISTFANQCQGSGPDDTTLLDIAKLGMPTSLLSLELQATNNLRSISRPYPWSRGPGLISKSQASCLGQAVNPMT